MEMESLRGELERLFDLDELKEISSTLLGFEPDVVGGTSSTAAYVQSLTTYCEDQGAIEALCDAVVGTRADAAAWLHRCREVGLRPEDKPSEGQSMGPFKLVRQIGEGSVGTCFAAESNEGQYRVKVLHREAIREPRGTHRFRTFNRMLASVSGPGLADGLTLGSEQGWQFVAHRWFEGQSLTQKVALGGPLPEAELRPLAIALAAALNSLHSAGLCHGDLKLENVLVADEDAHSIQLQDAGTDLLRSRRPANGHLEVLSIASPRSAAPEQLLGGSRSQAGDVFALGTVLYELACGHPPFEGENPLQVALKQLGPPPPDVIERAPEGWISRGLSELISRLLAKESNLRPSNAQAVLEELDLLAARQTASSRPNSERFDQLKEQFFADPSGEESLAALESAAVGDYRPAVYRALVEAGTRTAASPSTTSPAPLMAAPERAEDSALAGDQSSEPQTTPPPSSGDTRLRRSLLMRGARGLKSCGLTDEAAAVFLQVVTDDPTDEAAWHALDDCLRRLGKHEDRIDSLLSRLENAASPARRAAVMKQIGDIYADDLGQKAQAAIAYTQAFCETPTDTELVRRIEGAAGSSDETWNEVLGICNEASSDADRPTAERVPLLEKMGHWYTTKQPKPELALPCFQTALRLDPEHPGTLDGIASVYRSNRMWTELSDLLIRRADSSPIPTDARQLRAQAADVFESQLDDRDGAKRLYQLILSENPEDQTVAKALGRIYEHDNDIQSWLPLLERQANDEQGASRHAALCRMAELYRDKLSDWARASELYSTVLKEDPTHRVARSGLHQTLRSSEEFSRLLDSLKDQLQCDLTPREQVEVWTQIAQLQEAEFLQPEQAIQAYEKILEIDPSDRRALQQLAHLYRATEQWPSLSATLARSASLAENDDERFELLAARARVCVERCDDLSTALECYEPIVQARPDRLDIRQAIADLQETLGDTEKAVEQLAEVVDSTSDPAQQLQLCQRIVRILDRNDPANAKAYWLQKLLALDPANEEAIAGLRATYSLQGDQEGLLDLLRHEVNRSESLQAKSRLLLQIAEIEQTERGDRGAAKSAAKQALLANPKHLPAHWFLAQALYEEGEHAEAATHYQQVSQQLDFLSGDQPRVAIERLVECLHATGQLPADGGLQYAEQLLQIAPSDPVALRSAAQLSYRYGAPLRTQQLLEKLLALPDHGLTGEQLAETEFQLGDTLRILQQWQPALEHLRRASELNPESAQALLGEVQLHKDQNNWNEVVRTYDTLLGHSRVDNKHEILIELGEVTLEHLHEPERALSSFSAALELAPNDRRILRRLMQLYSELERWSELVAVVEKLAGFVEDSQQKAKYLMTAAKVSGRHLDERARAIAFYKQVLALDPDHPKALSECVVLQIEEGDTEGAEEALLRQLTRAQENHWESQQVEMYDALFALYHQVPAKLDEAVRVVRQAKTLRPDNPVHDERLAELYEQDPARYAEWAIPLNFEVLQRKPDFGPAYRRLRQVYTETRQADPAWCLCQVLELLKLAEPEETRFFERHRSPLAAPAQVSLTPEDWSDGLIHPLVNGRLTQIFAILEPTMVLSRSQTFDALGYDPALAVDLSHHPYPLAQMLFYVASVLGMAPPPTFENHHEPGGLLFLNSQPPSIVMGLGALQQIPSQTAAFIAARQLTHYRPGFHVRHLVSSMPVLKAWLFAALKSCNPNFPIAPELQGPVGEAKAALDRHLTPASRDRLVALVSELLAGNTSIDLKDWVTGVDLTADRVGLLLANDLKSVTDILKTSQDPTSPPRERRLQELVLFAISEPYFRARQKLGVAVESSS